MKKGISNKKKLFVSAFAVGVLGLSTLPLGASAQSYNNYNWNYGQHNRYDNDRHDRNNDWRARDVATRHHPGRGVIREDRYRNRDNDVIIIVIFVDGCHSYVRERDGAFLGSYYS